MQLDYFSVVVAHFTFLNSLLSRTTSRLGKKISMKMAKQMLDLPEDKA